MRKLLLITGILVCVLFNSYAVEKPIEYSDESNSSILSDQQNLSSDLQDLDLLIVEKTKKEKTLKNKTFIGKVKKKISSYLINKNNIFRSKVNIILPFILGFLFGPFGILFVFLVNLKKPKPERKIKVLASLWGLVLWLSIWGIILTATM